MSAPRSEEGQLEELPEPDALHDPALASFVRGGRSHDASADSLDWEALAHRLEDERGPAAWLCERSTRVRAFIAVAAAVACPLLVLLFNRRVDFGVYPLDRLAVDIALLLVPWVLALGLWLRPLHRPRASPRVVVAIGVVAVCAGIVLGALPEAHRAVAASLAGVGSDLVPRAVGCFAFGVVTAIPLAVVLGLASRQGRWWKPSIVAALSAALIGQLSVFFHCPLVGGVHLWLGHATVVVPALLVGWWSHRTT